MSLLSTACGDSGTTLAEGDAHLVVSLTGASAPMGHLLGWNIGRGTYYSPPGSTVHPEWRTPERAAAIERLSQIVSPQAKSPYVRFSGLQIDGSLGGDGYHFWDFVRPDRAVLATDNLSVSDYSAITSELGGDQTVTLNFGSGTSDEASRYATYLLGTDSSGSEVAARAVNGRADPYAVTAFEVGNEVYGFWNTGNSATGTYSYANPSSKNGGDGAWFGKPSSDAADFAARALEYVHAVTAVAPGTRFWVPLSQSSMDAWGGLDAALGALDPLLRDPAVDAVVIHLYETDDAKTLGVGDVNAPELMLAGSELFRPLFDGLRNKLNAIDRSPRVGIAVTEYHVASGLSHATFELGGTAAVGLALADLMIMLAQAGVDHAMQHLALSFDATKDALVEAWYNPFRWNDGSLLDMPSYTVTRLFAEHTFGTRIDPAIAKMPRSHTPLDVAGKYDLIHAVAFGSADGVTGTLVFTQRDLSAPMTVTFDLDPGCSVVSAKQWAPEALDQDVTTDAVPVTALPFDQEGNRVRVVAAPHSVVAIRFVRN